MSGYTGRPHRNSAGAASAEKIARAGSGSPRSVSDKLEKIAEYIRTQARARFNGDVDQVPCPDVPTWDGLAVGRTPTLPSRAQMSLFATKELRDASAALGDMRLAYFEAARALLKGTAAE